MVAHGSGSLLANLREQFAEFLQHRSLKRLGILYQSTCVGLGYGLYRRSYFLEHLRGRTNPIRTDNTRYSSLPAGRGMFAPFPSTTPFGLALGAG